jgi:hypothetical protein
MAFCSYACGPLPDHEIVACGEYKLGGISAAAILNCDADDLATADFSDDETWTTWVGDGSAKPIRQIKGTIASPAAVEVPNPIACGPENILVGFNWTCTWQDANATGAESGSVYTGGNTDFYCDLNTRTTYLALYLCGSDEVMIVNFPTNYRAALMVPDNDRALQMFEVSATAYIPVGSCIQKYPAPPTFFDVTPAP